MGKFRAEYYVCSIHTDMGDIFQVVTPEQLNIGIADADVLMDVLNRRTEFTKYQPVNSASSS